MLGLDLLGLGHKLWPINATIKTVPKGWAIGCFAETFGDALPNLRKLLLTGRYPAVRVHLWWADDHRICPLEVIERLAPKYDHLAGAFPEVKFYLSHSCEHNERNAVHVKKRIALLKKLAPRCIAVNTPWKGAVVSGVVTERHGIDATADIVSTDGVSAYDIDLGGYLRRNKPSSLISFVWVPRFNLLKTMGDRRIAPRNRTFVPNTAYLREVVMYTKMKEVI